MYVCEFTRERIQRTVSREHSASSAHGRVCIPA